MSPVVSRRLRLNLSCVCAVRRANPRGPTWYGDRKSQETVRAVEQEEVLNALSSRRVRDNHPPRESGYPSALHLNLAPTILGASAASRSRITSPVLESPNCGSLNA